MNKNLESPEESDLSRKMQPLRMELWRLEGLYALARQKRGAFMDVGDIEAIKRARDFGLIDRE